MTNTSIRSPNDRVPKSSSSNYRVHPSCSAMSPAKSYVTTANFPKPNHRRCCLQRPELTRWRRGRVWWKQASLTAVRWPLSTAMGSGDGRCRGFSGLAMSSAVRGTMFSLARSVICGGPLLRKLNLIEMDNKPLIPPHQLVRPSFECTSFFCCNLLVCVYQK
jgi:hypothetical protein